VVVEWVLSTIGAGAAIAISAQLTLTESIGFECSKSGLTVLTRLSQINDAVVQKESIKLNIGKKEIDLDPVFMLETKPQFWAGTVSDPQSVLTLILNSPDFVVTVPGRRVELNFDEVKMRDFVSECQKRVRE
jgi:hypothetical protein